MARTFYGGRFSDLFAQVSVTDGDFEPGTGTFKAFTSRTGATQHTDLLTWASASITVVGPDANGYMRFQGQDGYTGTYWMEDATAGGTRFPIDPVDLAERGGGGSSDVGQLDDLTDVTFSGTPYTAGKTLRANGSAFVDSTLAADDLSDVVITSPATKQAIIHNGTNWVNRLPLLDDASDVVITTPADGQVVQHDGTNWFNAKLDAADLTGLDPVAISGDYSDLSGTPTAPTQELYEAVTTGYPTRAPTQYPRGLHKGPTKPTDGNSIDGDIWQKFATAFPEVP